MAEGRVHFFFDFDVGCLFAGFAGACSRLTDFCLLTLTTAGDGSGAKGLPELLLVLDEAGRLLLADRF